MVVTVSTYKNDMVFFVNILRIVTVSEGHGSFSGHLFSLVKCLVFTGFFKLLERICNDHDEVFGDVNDICLTLLFSNPSMISASKQSE